ncbi:MAG: TetR/AcrR family transcriptional regulator [Deltaproteobacteria bacterium]|nr:TetR/AcrR family transcriptional regulator [Deltaproteobacteria bacterium]
MREILAAARTVFSERGYEAAAITEIARRAGVVEGTIYKHFDSKRDLLHRVVRDFYEALIDDVDAGIRGIRGAANRLRFLIGRHLQAFSADRGLCRLLIREIRPDGELYDSSIENLGRRYTRAASQALQDGIDSGELRDDIEPAMVRHMIYGAVEHVVWRFVFRGGRLDVDRVADELTRAVLHGIVPQASPSGAVERLEARIAGLERRFGRGRPRRTERA